MSERQSRQNSQNYFFVADGKHGFATVYARGKGIEIVESIARLSLFAAAFSPESIEKFEAVELAHQVVQHKAEKEILPFEHVTHAARLASIMRGSRSLAPSDFSDRLTRQIWEGARSPQSVMDQLKEHDADSRRARECEQLWYDGLGRRVLSTYWRGREPEPNDENLALGKVRRDDPDFKIMPETKEALYAAVPDRAKVRVNRTLPITMTEFSSMLVADFVSPDGEMLENKTFGYLDQHLFVPVVTELAGESLEPPAEGDYLAKLL